VLTPQDVAERFQVSERTVYEWLRSGELAAAKVGGSLWRIDERDLERFFERQIAEQLLVRVRRDMPDVEWQRGRCVQCGKAIPIPPTPSYQEGWVCGERCRGQWYELLYQVIDRGSPEEVNVRRVEVVPYWL
jgi:excisionase family DNA binding protein